MPFSFSRRCGTQERRLALVQTVHVTLRSGLHLVSMLQIGCRRCQAEPVSRKNIIHSRRGMDENDRDNNLTLMSEVDLAYHILKRPASRFILGI